MSSVGFVGSLENMLFGDPVYDERGQVVKRNFGLMNAAMIVLLVVLGIGLFKGFPNMKPKSGKKKMKGGAVGPTWKKVAGGILFCVVLAFISSGVYIGVCLLGKANFSICNNY